MPQDEGRASSDERAALARAFLLNVVVPAWIAPGYLDWIWHRQTKIERTAGAHESLTHLLMAMEGGVGIAAGLLFEIDAGVIAVAFAAALAHEATVVWDVAYAKHRRKLPQYEQHTHSFMEVLPFVTAAFFAFLNPEQTRALVGRTREKPRFAFRVKRDADIVRTAALVALSGILGTAPYVEEFVRCLRVTPTLAPQPVSPDL